MDKAFGIKSRLHLKEAESTAQSVVNHRKATVCRVHHADDIQISGDRERQPVIRQRRLGTPVVPLNQHQQFAEYLAHVATVDFVNDEKEFLVRLVCGLLAKPIEDTVFQFKSILNRLIAHHKVLVRIILVELDELNAAVVFFTHHRPC